MIDVTVHVPFCGAALAKSLNDTPATVKPATSKNTPHKPSNTDMIVPSVPAIFIAFARLCVAPQASAWTIRPPSIGYAGSRLKKAELGAFRGVFYKR
ncbi:MAG TPA: hypothetical protein VMW12_01730 [Candidatus Dormibacteraeota bacterium]|nr:hypothetical protein [Candidatus Dormibacteraeota bacterium]